MNATQERVQSASVSLHQNLGVEDEDVAHRQGLEEQLRHLQQRLSPVAFASLEAENEAYKAELAQATQMLQESKSAETRAVAAAEELQAEVRAQHNATENAAMALHVAKQEGQAQLRLAVEAAAADKAHSEAALARAQDAVAERCRAE